MLYKVGGNPGDVDGGFAFEYLNNVATCIQNFIAKDPITFLQVSPGQQKSNIQLTFEFLQQVFVMNQNSKAKTNGIIGLKIVISIFENLPG